MQKLLQEGDVIKLEKGHMVYAEIPQHFIYENRKGVFNETGNTEVKIGENRNGFPTDYLIGEWVVTKTHFGGGGTAHGPGDIYPDGHKVYCTKIGNEDLKVSFYQSGSFTAMIRDIEPIGKAKCEWRKEL